MTELIKYKYKCEYCGKPFVREDRYLAHKCKKMEKHAISKTTLGHAAWFYYQTWMKKQKKAAPNSSAFMNSRYFNAFIRFAEFVIAKNLPDVDTYIQMMIDESNSPSIWTNQMFYEAYLTYLDKKADPLHMLRISLETLRKYADDHDLGPDFSKIFDIIEVNEVIDLIRKRKLSAWLLLNSTKFGQYLRERVHGEQRVVLHTLIKPHFWQHVFAEKQDDINRIREKIHSINL